MLKELSKFYKKKRILVTGHTGFKGSWLSLWLTRIGAEVFGYAQQPPTKPNLFQTLYLDKKITSIIADIRDLKKLKKVFSKYKPEIVFHLAAQPLVSESYKKPVETYETNVMGTVNVLEAIRKTKGVKAVVIITSDKCYENKEKLYGYKETDALGGSDPYSSSKACIELIVRTYHDSFFKQTKSNLFSYIATARSGNVIGGGDWAKDRLIPDCIRAFVKKKPVTVRRPKAVRPWQHVLEPTFGYLLLAKALYQKRTTFTGAWNFGPKAKDVKTVEKVIEQLVKIWRDKASWKTIKEKPFPEAKYLKLNCFKAKSKLSWFPQWNLKLALKKTVDWYKTYYNHKNMVGFTLDQVKDYERNIK